MNMEYLSYNLEVKDSELTVAVTATSKQGIRKIDFYEEEGIVQIGVRSVPKSFLFDNTANDSFTASEDIRQVWIGDRIIWANGEMISPLTASLYEVYNPYVGNMPSNGKIVTVLNMAAYTGNFQNELQTTNAPYTWKMILEHDFSKEREEALQERLKIYSYILLADIGNLDEVLYEYTIDGIPKKLSVTSEQASEYAGVDIKSVGEDINRLEKLVRKTGLSNIVYGGVAVESNAQVDFSFASNTEQLPGFTVINYADDDIYGMELQVKSGSTTAKQATVEANGNPYVQGQSIEFQMLPEDFEKKIKDGDQGRMELWITDQNGKKSKVQGEVNVDIIWGTQYRLNLSGNAESGYFLGH